MRTPGTYSEADDVAVPFPDALRAWAAEALPALVQTAGSYNRVITYAELGEEVQQRTGIRTRMLLMNWIGQVLEQVAAECERRGELLLTALCVRTDGTVGEGYAGAVGRHFGQIPEDAELHAAGVRLDCYRKYAHDIPANGGLARLTPQELARRRAANPEPAAQVCPVHNTALPRSGQCDDCV